MQELEQNEKEIIEGYEIKHTMRIGGKKFDFFDYRVSHRVGGSSKYFEKAKQNTDKRTCFFGYAV